MDLPELFGTTSKHASVLASSHDKKFCLYFIDRIVYQPYAMIGGQPGESLYNVRCLAVVSLSHHICLPKYLEDKHTQSKWSHSHQQEISHPASPIPLIP